MKDSHPTLMYTGEEEPGNEATGIFIITLLVDSMYHGSQLIHEQRGHHVTCALFGTSRKLAAYNYTSSLALLNNA